MSDKNQKNPEVEPQEGVEAAETTNLTEDDLLKSLKALEDYNSANNEVDRKEALLSKALESQLSDEEQDELSTLLKGKAEPKESFGDEVIQPFEENETLNKSIDVSDFLKEHTEEIKKSLSAVGDRVEKNEKGQFEFNLTLAKAFGAMGKAVHEIKQTLDTIASQPARGPKAAMAKPLEKSFAGQGEQAQSAKLSKSDVMEKLEDMFRKSCDEGNEGYAHGFNLMKSISELESCNTIDPKLLKVIEAAGK